MTQCSEEQLDLPVPDQRHEPLAFLVSQFRKAEKSWTTFEKEAYAIFQTYDKLDYILLTTQPSHVYTDHKNPLFIFAPLTLEPALGRHVVSKLQRWALFLSRFSYVIEHVDGKQNVFPDILTRWTKGYREDSLRLKTVCSLFLVSAEQIVPSAADIEWPNLHLIRRSQRYASARTMRALTLDKEEAFKKQDGKIWISCDDAELKLKLMVISHCGSVGHRGADDTKSILKEKYAWKYMDDDVDKFVRGCFHCILSRTGEMIPLPMASALHGEKPNEVIHLDFLYMGSGVNRKKYILILREYHSSYVWLWTAEAATSEEAADAIINWIGAFGCMDWISSDQGSHFENKLIRNLTE